MSELPTATVSPVPEDQASERVAEIFADSNARKRSTSFQTSGEPWQLNQNY